MFTMPLNVYTDFVKETIAVVDGDNVKLPDADRLFITVNS